MRVSHRTKGVCASQIEIEIEGDRIKEVCFDGGCSGNSKAVSALVRGMNARDAIERLRGIKCGTKQSSCPDQLAQALESLIND